VSLHLQDIECTVCSSLFYIYSGMCHELKWYIDAFIYEYEFMHDYLIRQNTL